MRPAEQSSPFTGTARTPIPHTPGPVRPGRPMPRRRIPMRSCSPRCSTACATRRPSRASELPSEYAVTPAQMRDIVQRDLAYLLNTTNAEDLIDRTRHAEAASSTINFGVPPLAGSYLSERKWADIERIIRRAIQDYEPRLIPETVTVVPLMKEGGAAGDYNVLLFEIRALIHLSPIRWHSPCRARSIWRPTACA
jgi:type VI secretion system protein ImpF